LLLSRPRKLWKPPRPLPRLSSLPLSLRPKKSSKKLSKTKKPTSITSTLSFQLLISS